MAEWIYKTELVASVTDSPAGWNLAERGAAGWELVQMVPTSMEPRSREYRLIFKAEKPLGS